MILAAASKFIINSTQNEVVLCGINHDECFKQLLSIGLKPDIDFVLVSKGFIDTKNNFLSRQEAYNHAKECGQLPRRIIEERELSDNNNFLITKDLW